MIEHRNHPVEAKVSAPVTSDGGTTRPAGRLGGGRIEFQRRMEQRRSEGEAPEMVAALRRGWRLGAADFLQRLTEKLARRGQRHERASERRHTDTEGAERMVRGSGWAGLQQGMCRNSEPVLACVKMPDPFKVGTDRPGRPRVWIRPFGPPGGRAPSVCEVVGSDRWADRTSSSSVSALPALRTALMPTLESALMAGPDATGSRLAAVDLTPNKARVIKSPDRPEAVAFLTQVAANSTLFRSAFRIPPSAFPSRGPCIEAFG